MHQQQTAFENIVRNGELARNEQFLLFQQCILLNQIIISPFIHVFDITSLFAAELEEPKIGISGKGLTNKYQGTMHYFPGNIYTHESLCPHKSFSIKYLAFVNFLFLLTRGR